jgi:L,D-transpeptidase ErfK/SrfK
VDVSFVGAGRVERFVARTAKEVFVEPVNASIGIADEGGLEFNRSRPGSALNVRRAQRLLTRALEEGTSRVRLPMRAVTPRQTVDTMLPTIVVRVDQNRLDLYEGFRVTHSWDVATAKPGWVTPVGEWNLYQKRENPTWYNPAQDTWGADLPPMIAPGPGNPLGTRAIYLNAPGIRIHGTYSTSSIGTYASHGCIRMYISDSEELFNLVDTGTRVIIKP